MTTATETHETASDRPNGKAGQPSTMTAIRSTLHAIERELNQTFSEREREVRCLVVAALAGEHLLLLGPAGTAKSALANTFCSAIRGANFFAHLLTRFSPPEELFGPLSLEGLKNDRYRRVTTRMLPECHVGFIDEIYKANSAILNSLLTLLNERKFDNDGHRTTVPLVLSVAASNELPEGPELAALHDRFMLRTWVTYTKTPDAFKRLLTGTEPAIQTSISLDDLRAAQAAVRAIPISDIAVEELFKLREEVKTDGVVASDRRWRKAVSVLRAVAWLDGATEVTPETFPILSSVLWETVDQIAKLQQKVSKYTSAELADAQDITDAMGEIVNNLPSKTTEGYEQKLTSTVKELKKAAEKLDKLAKSCGGVQSKAKIKAMHAEVSERYNSLRAEAAKALGL